LFLKWIAAMKRDKWQPSAADVICSEHFESHCFRFYNSQARLKEDAVPSIFKFPLHLQKQVKVRRALIRHEMEDATDAPSSSTTNLNDAAVAESRSPVNKTALLHHNYSMLSSPSAVKRKYDMILNRERQLKQLASKRLKVARRRLFRQQTKMSNMKDIITQLKSKTDVSRTAIDLIESCFGSIPAELLRRKLLASSKEVYSDVTRSFAMTLHFYSAKAYNFVRSSFGNALPHPATLRTWYRAVDGKPGFTEEAFEVKNELVITIM
jgi:hypothetical protein